MLYATVAVMVFALAGMIWCAKKQKTNANAQTYAVICLVVVFICAIAVMIQTNVFGTGGETQKLIQNELAYSKSRAVIVGRHLAEKYPGSKALVITDGSNPLNKSQEQLLEGLKEGIGSAITIESAEGLPIDKTNMKPEEYRPMEEMMSAVLFDKLIALHPNANMVITLIGLPYDVPNMSLWKMPESGRPKVALLTGDIHQLKGAILAKYIVAAVSMRPDLKNIEEKAPSDPQKAFDIRYVLITPDNVVKIATDYKGIFE